MFAPPASLAVITPDFFFLGQQQGDNKVGMKQPIGQADQFAEYIAGLAAFGRFAPADGVAYGRFPHNPLLLSNRVQDLHDMFGQQA